LQRPFSELDAAAVGVAPILLLKAPEREFLWIASHLFCFDQKYDEFANGIGYSLSLKYVS